MEITLQKKAFLCSKYHDAPINIACLDAEIGLSSLRALISRAPALELIANALNFDSSPGSWEMSSGAHGMLSEHELIGLIRERVFHQKEPSHSFLDDCARLDCRFPSGMVLSTDLLLEDVHFRRTTISPRDLGWKTLAVNLSDLASSGATPLGFLFSWSLPPVEKAWVEEFLAGLDEAARRYQCPLLGGDTCRGKNLSFHVTVLGEEPPTGPVIRSQAQAGEVVAVTGVLGLSGLGFSLLEGETKEDSVPVVLRQKSCDRHRRPLPRMEEGRFLAAHGVRAMMDLSDGLFRDLPKFARAAGCGFEVKIEQVPLPVGADTWDLDRARAFAAFGGEDYELLFSISPLRWPALQKDFQARFDLPLTKIGQLTSDLSAQWQGLVARPEDLPSLCFEHF